MDIFLLIRMETNYKKNCKLMEIKNNFKTFITLSIVKSWMESLCGPSSWYKYKYLLIKCINTNITI